MTVIGCIDSPAEDELTYQHGIQVQGWVRIAHDDRPWRGVAVRFGEHIFGVTVVRIARPDVAEFFGDEKDDVGFVLYCTIPVDVRAVGVLTLECVVADADGNWHEFGRRTVRQSTIDYRMHGHGAILQDGAVGVLARDEVYGSGPPSPVADGSCVDLIMRYILPGETVLDVGCGIGAYCGALAPFGVEWTGCEAREDFVERMHDAGMRAVRSTNQLPFADRTFDATICIEVLEHVNDYRSFLAEVSRVSRRAAVFSVPNFGAIPISSSFYALPWHMLESDHKSFFTVRSLQTLLSEYYRHVETFEYGPLPALRSSEGIPINNHVFAVCYH